MAEYVQGGPGVLAVWALTANEAGALAKTFSLTNQTTVTPDASGVYTVTPENEEDSAAFQTFLEAALPVGTSTVTEAERTREDGTKVGGGASGGTQYVIGVTGPIAANGTGSTRKFFGAVAVVDPSSGGYTQKAGEPSKRTIVFKTIPAAANTTIALATVNLVLAADGSTALYAAVADLVISSGMHGRVFWPIKA